MAGKFRRATPFHKKRAKPDNYTEGKEPFLGYVLLYAISDGVILMQDLYLDYSQKGTTVITKLFGQNIALFKNEWARTEDEAYQIINKNKRDSILKMQKAINKIEKISPRLITNPEILKKKMQG